MAAQEGAVREGFLEEVPQQEAQYEEDWVLGGHGPIQEEQVESTGSVSSQNHGFGLAAAPKSGGGMRLESEAS